LHDHDLLAGAVRTDTRGVNPATPRSRPCTPWAEAELLPRSGRSDARRL